MNRKSVDNIFCMKINPYLFEFNRSLIIQNKADLNANKFNLCWVAHLN